MKKISVFLLALTLVLCFAGTVRAGELLSPAIRVMQTEVGVTKTGVGKNSVCFSEADFAAVFGDASFAAIEITALPTVEAGTLKLGAVDVTPGQLIPQEALSALRFVPGTGDETEASFSFRPYGGLYEDAFVGKIYLLDALNFAPTATDSTLSAMERIPASATLAATDPDGDELHYRILEAPKNGTLTLDEASGAYRYTASSAGEDRFSFAAIDAYGNVSAPSTVVVNISENPAGFVYADLQNGEAQTAAVRLAAKGIFVGETVGASHFFYPDRTVSRAEFLTMAMASAGIDVENGAEKSSAFADRSDFSAAQASAIGTAERLGLVVGMDTERGRCFCPDEAISAVQAATILARIAAYRGGTSSELLFVSARAEEELSDVSYAMMASSGYVLPSDKTAILTRADAAKLLCSAQ